MGNDQTRSPADKAREWLGQHGWVGRGVTVIMHGDTADLSLPFKVDGETHELYAQYTVATGGWRPESLFLLSSRNQPCPLPRGMNAPNLSCAEAEAVGHHLPDMLMLRALACRPLYDDADEIGTVIQQVTKQVGLKDWGRHRLFAAAAWMLAEGWWFGDTLITSSTLSESLVIAIKRGLRRNVESFLSLRNAELEALRREND